VGIRVRGRDLPELFEQAGNGLIELMFGRGGVRARRSIELSASGEDAEEMLVDWLQAILFAFEADAFAAARVEVESVGEGTVSGRLFGEDFDEVRHAVQYVVKAITYHDLRIRRAGDLYETDIIVDV